MRAGISCAARPARLTLATVGAGDRLRFSVTTHATQTTQATLSATASRASGRIPGRIESSASTATAAARAAAATTSAAVARSFDVRLRKTGAGKGETRQDEHDKRQNRRDAGMIRRDRIFSHNIFQIHLKNQLTI
jgi:hypothetical protein